MGSRGVMEINCPCDEGVQGPSYTIDGRRK